jgi:ABC-2 type transport system permease protein
MRRLDVAKIEREKTAWQIVNVALPVVLIVLFGILLAVLRKKTFTKTK